jgi:hypothetical protein
VSFDAPISSPSFPPFSAQAITDNGTPAAMRVRKARSLKLRDRPVTEVRKKMNNNAISSEKALASSTKSFTENDYQREALFQNKVLFWASLIGAYLAFILGLVPISYLLIMYPFVPLHMTVLSSLLGAALELVSGFLFRQMRETKKIVTAHHDQLREDKHLLEAERITFSIENANLRDREKQYLARAHMQKRSSGNEKTLKRVIVRELLKLTSSDARPRRKNSSEKP